VTVDGGPIASSAGDRQFELTGAATGNIDRIEVTKSPTPDMPANAIGGAINIVGKSGFSRTKPLFTYSVYGTFNLLDDPTGLQPSFSKRAGTDSRTAGRTIQPGVDLSYILPVNDKLALTFSAGMSTRYNYYDSAYTLWNLVTNVDERFYKTDTIIISDRTLAAATVDWRLNKENTFRFSAQISSEHFKVATSTTRPKAGPVPARCSILQEPITPIAIPIISPFVITTTAGPGSSMRTRPIRRASAKTPTPRKARSAASRPATPA
jgi:outer membrane receptor protein involved in Fe transport